MRGARSQAQDLYLFARVGQPLLGHTVTQFDSSRPGSACATPSRCRADLVAGGSESQRCGGSRPSEHRDVVVPPPMSTARREFLSSGVITAMLDASGCRTSRSPPAAAATPLDDVLRGALTGTAHDVHANFQRSAHADRFRGCPPARRRYTLWVRTCSTLLIGRMFTHARFSITLAKLSGHTRGS